MIKEFRSINAVHEHDLNTLLDSVGLLEDFKKKKLKCKFCGDVVTDNNIFSVIRDSDRYKLVCSKARCVSSLMEFLNKRQIKAVNNE